MLLSTIQQMIVLFLLARVCSSVAMPGKFLFFYDFFTCQKLGQRTNVDRNLCLLFILDFMLQVQSALD